MAEPFKQFDAKRKKWGYKTDFTAANKRWRVWFPKLEQAKEFQRNKEGEALAIRHGLQSAKPKQKKITLDQLRAAFAASLPTEKKDKRALDIGSLLIEQNGANFPVAEIQAKHLRALVEYLQANGYADATVKSYYSLARCFLGFAAIAFPETFDDDYRPASLNLRRLAQKLKPVKRTRILTFDEIKTLAATILDVRQRHERFSTFAYRRDHLYDFFALQFLTCKRRGEIAAIDWPDVLLDAGILRVKLTKINRTQMLPLSSEARKIFMKRKALGYATVWPKTIYSKVIHSYPWIGERAGIPHGSQIAGGWVGHDLRHTAATYAVRSGANPLLVSFLLGHRLAEGETQTYTNLADGDLAETLESIATIWREKCRHNDVVSAQNPSITQPSEAMPLAA